MKIIASKLTVSSLVWHTDIALLETVTPDAVLIVEYWISLEYTNYGIGNRHGKRTVLIGSQEHIFSNIKRFAICEL